MHDVIKWLLCHEEQGIFLFLYHKLVYCRALHTVLVIGVENSYLVWGTAMNLAICFHFLADESDRNRVLFSIIQGVNCMRLSCACGRTVVGLRGNKSDGLCYFLLDLCSQRQAVGQYECL